jgi:hypothetical protein
MQGMMLVVAVRVGKQSIDVPAQTCLLMTTTMMRVEVFSALRC